MERINTAFMFLFAALFRAFGFLVGRTVFFTLWCYKAFMMGYRAGL